MSLGELVIEGGRLFRGRQGARVELAVATGEPLGEVYDLARDPAGLSFVAAEGGLFVVSDDVAHLDRVERADGAPEGVPQSVWIDAERRVWLATDRAIGVLEPSFFYGREITALEGEEAPLEPPYRLDAEPDGGLRIHGKNGSRLYMPDAAGGSPLVVPRMQEVVVGERRFPREAEAEQGPLALVHGERPLFRATGTGRGGASYRFRVDLHHVWRNLEPGVTTLPVLSPGRHELDVVALDQDLNASEPLRVPITVAYPWYYEPRIVLGLLALLGGAVLLVFFLRARRQRGRGDGPAYVRGVVSAGLCIVFALQVLAGLVPHGRGWPFMGFDMYTDRYGRNDAIYDTVLVGADGERTFLIDPQQVGVAVDSRWQVLRPLIDGGQEAARAYAQAFRERHPRTKLERLQVHARRVRLTDEGPVRVAPLILSDADVSTSGAGDD